MSDNRNASRQYPDTLLQIPHRKDLHHNNVQRYFALVPHTQQAESSISTQSFS